MKNRSRIASQGGTLMLLFTCCNTLAQDAAVPSSIHFNTLQAQGPVERKIVPSMATWHMDSALIELAATYTPFRVLANLRSLSRDHDLMNDSVYDQIKRRAAYAKEKGISLVADLDVRLALRTFENRYPGELQQALVLREIELKKKGAIELSFPNRTLKDHYHKVYPARSGAFVKAFAYNLTSDGLIDPVSLKDVSDQCVVTSATKDAVLLKVPGSITSSSYRLMVMVSFTYLYPDIFSPRLIEFRDAIISKYADAGLAGAHDDEWGFPPAISEDAVQNEFWYSANRAKAYAQRTGGRDLLNDLLLMRRGIAGKEPERISAINHFQEMGRDRNIELENGFYSIIKKTFGPEGIVAVHPTWFPYPERREFKKNGLDWWGVKRDWAQTDEVVPYGIRTALAKKWNSPVWYNMFYRFATPAGSEGANDYEDELWSAALAGGRISNLPHIGIPQVLASDFVRAETRVRLLNYIDPAPLNSPVAVIFGHAAAMNWAGPAFEDVGMNLVDSFWRMGIPADLIPTSEISNNSLTIDKEGYICYGKQRYQAVILYNPEFELPATAQFFNRVASGKTRLYRIGRWTMDFNGKKIDVKPLLPNSLKNESNLASIIKEIPSLLRAVNIPLQTPATRIMEGFGHASLAPPTTGFSYLLDGTLVQVAATRHSTGDTIQSTKKIGKYDVTVDAIGVVAVRLDEKGNIEALAAGGLKSLSRGKFHLDLDERIDLAIWKNSKGAWEGLVQGWNGEIPAPLLAITSAWSRLDLPKPYPSNPTPAFKKVVVAEAGTGTAGDELVRDIDGNSYRTFRAGRQIWMSDNLRTSRYNNGEPITLPGDNKAEWYSNKSGAYAWYENDSTKYEGLYGKLYNWQAVQTGKLCPAGWHVPTVREWKELLNYLDSTGANKSFNPLPAGYRHSYGTYFASGRNGFWWTASETRNRIVWEKQTKLLYAVNDRELAPTHGLCVRCIKN